MGRVPNSDSLSSMSCFIALSMSLPMDWYSWAVGRLALRVVTQEGPTSDGVDPENVLLTVSVDILQVFLDVLSLSPRLAFGTQLRAPSIESISDVFEEHQS